MKEEDPLGLLENFFTKINRTKTHLTLKNDTYTIGPLFKLTLFIKAT